MGGGNIVNGRYAVKGKGRIPRPGRTRREPRITHKELVNFFCPNQNPLERTKSGDENSRETVRHMKAKPDFSEWNFPEERKGTRVKVGGRVVNGEKPSGDGHGNAVKESPKKKREQKTTGKKLTEK